MWGSRAQQSGPDRGGACLLAAFLLCFSLLHAQDYTPSQTPPPTSNTSLKPRGRVQKECKFSEKEAGFYGHAPFFLEHRPLEWWACLYNESEALEVEPIQDTHIICWIFPIDP